MIKNRDDQFPLKKKSNNNGTPRRGIIDNTRNQVLVVAIINCLLAFQLIIYFVKKAHKENILAAISLLPDNMSSALFQYLFFMTVVQALWLHIARILTRRWMYQMHTHYTVVSSFYKLRFIIICLFLLYWFQACLNISDTQNDSPTNNREEFTTVNQTFVQ